MKWNERGTGSAAERCGRFLDPTTEKNAAINCVFSVVGFFLFLIQSSTAECAAVLHRPQEKRCVHPVQIPD